MASFDAYLGGFTRSQSPVANSGLLQNQYLEILPPGSISRAAHYPTPGMERFGAVPQVGGRAFFSTKATDGRVFSVHGQRLYEWFTDGSALDRGAVAIDGNPATIVTNGSGGQQLGITSGGNYYSYDLLTNALTQVVFLNGKATTVGFSGGYFLVFDIATGTVYQSDLFDGTTFDPANFFQRSVQADDWIAMVVLPWGQIFLPGTQTRDNYYNAGTFPIPFAPANSGVQPDGCAATFAVTIVDKWVCWLGTTAQGGYNVFATTGYESQTISTEAIAFALAQFSDLEIATATGEAHTDQGHNFFLLYVGNNTFVFDFKTGEWHTRRTFVSQETGELGAWRPRWHCFGFNKSLWLDAQTGVVYESNIEFVNDVDDLLIQRQRVTGTICAGNQQLDIGDFELLMQVGVGNPAASAATDPGVNPQIWLEISRDGGMTWGRARMASIGREGAYSLRVRWQSNGSGRKIVFRVTCADPVHLRIMGAELDIRGERGQPIDLRMAA